MGVAMRVRKQGPRACSGMRPDEQRLAPTPMLLSLRCRVGGASVSYPARGPVLTGIDGKANGFGRRRDNVSITHEIVSEAPL